MKKEKMIASILDDAKIHHNIRISFSKLPDSDEADEKLGYDVMRIGGYMVEQFCEDWDDEKINDKGNRNLCGCKDKGPDSICRKHDLWHCYTHGRMGATLYWDKYWDSRNSGYSFKYDESDLQAMSAYEVKTISKEMAAFIKAVGGLMASFYDECRHQLEKLREEKKVEDMAEAEYQALKTQVVEKEAIKRLASELLLS